ncbi:MAG TPA: dipeptide ABC transporter ATP-binding protein [Tissierellia bacterium]|jgi:oligopeptide transport system ATP-binding protein|nr:dipeptide ABC transporter ATP-binding protein [Tissierellia bacterium]
MNENKPILSINNLSKRFKLRGGKLLEKQQILHALSNVSLDIYEGETLGVIGESGCGKSTLGRCIVQLHKPSSGEIIYKGENILNKTGKELKQLRKDIQIIFQDPYSSLDPRKTAGAAIEEPMIIHNLYTPKERKEKVLSLMKEVGLDTQHVYRYPHEFSGGQRQRINIARALALDPKIIVCDEPVSALDVSVQAQVLNLLNDLQKKHNLTLIFISHDLSVIKHVSNRVAIMYLGKVVELCDSKEIYTNPKHPYTQALLSAIPPESPFEKKVQIELKGEIPSPIGEQKGCALATRCPYVTERCTKEIPVLRDVADGHQVACFLY